MARQSRITPPGVAQHVVQRGNNRQAIFYCDEDRRIFSTWLSEYARECGVAVHAWVLMTNHVHFLLTPDHKDSLPCMMQSLGRRYVRYFNTRYERTGTLYDGRYKSCVVGNDVYLLACYRYIEMNPVRAALVKQPQDHPWSSFGYNALGNTCRLTRPNPAYIGLGDVPEERQANYRSLFDWGLSLDAIEEIRVATQSGHALGSDRFKYEIETTYACRLRPGRRGRRQDVNCYSDPN